MSNPEEDTEKPHEPSQKKLEDARKKGDIARSADLITSASYGGFLLAALLIGPGSIHTIGSGMIAFLDQSPELEHLFFSDGSTAVAGSLLRFIIFGFALWLLIPAMVALTFVVSQRGLVFTPSKLSPKISRIDPIRNAKNKYGWMGLFEFAKSTSKLVLFAAMLGIFLTHKFPQISGSLHGEPTKISFFMAKLITEFLFAVLAISVVIGVVDQLWQRHSLLKRNRMSDREIKDENRQQEGDPHMKQERRQRSSALISSQKLADVKKADVVIVNPTHFAVALSWSGQSGSAPVCVAKGVDNIALKIRDVAFESGVPVKNDPPTARALYSTVKIGSEIDPEFYRPVAVAIRFAEEIRRKAQSFGKNKTR